MWIKEQKISKKYIFPIAETFGFAPITADDVLTYGHNIAAKISALIERSSVVVIDISNQTTLDIISINIIYRCYSV